ncbi:MAG: DUF2027 domain-containing protein [Prolixibacteraceae bacterium]|nr:DUF2027 domain-containing protein [Prolixibacteraceae bacterium]
MFKVGDKVKFLNAVGGGTVTGYVSPKVVNVEDEQGFEVPCLVTELVKDERNNIETEEVIVVHGKVEVEEQRKPKKESLSLFASSAGNPSSKSPAWFLAFVPRVPTLPLSGEIKIWLVNDSPNVLLYHFSRLIEGVYHSEKSSRLAPYSRQPLWGFSHEDLSHFPDFGIQILPYQSQTVELENSFSKTIKVNPVKFYKESLYQGSAYFETRAMLIELKDNDLSLELEKLKQHDFSAQEIEENSGDRKRPRIKKTLPAGQPREVDLHIHELVESTAGLEPKDILEIQMQRFRAEMEAAIVGQTKRIVFIHGVGQGTLKNELRRELSNVYKKYDFQDASFHEYGYGATVVILRK